MFNNIYTKKVLKIFSTFFVFNVREDKRIEMYYQTKTPYTLQYKGFIIIWRLPTLPHLIAVPSADWGLTSLFGMGRGEHPTYNHHKAFICMNYEVLSMSIML